MLFPKEELNYYNGTLPGVEPTRKMAVTDVAWGGGDFLSMPFAYIYLYHSATADGKFEKLIDITSYPDVFSAPEKLDISDLSSNQKKYTQGMVDIPDYEFGFIYDKAKYKAVKDLEDGKTHYYQLRFGENGEFGAWQWSGTHFAKPNGGSVGAAREGTVICYPESEVTETTISA